VAAAIEQGNDGNGIIWPAPIAPFEFSLIAIGESGAVAEAADGIYAAIQAAGMDALIDDRDERPGVKFKDADLMGLPYRIVISEKTLKDGECEFKKRTDSQPVRWKLSELSARLNTISPKHQ